MTFPKHGHFTPLSTHQDVHKVVAHPKLPYFITSARIDKYDPKSAMILWKTLPVGPLCKSGGVQELARVLHKTENAFKYIGWVPAILPPIRVDLSLARSSPTGCFIAWNGRSLTVYQAVEDGTADLREPNLKGLFNIASTQSTAKPGCVLEIGKIDAAVKEHSSLLLLHVFNERLFIDNEGDEHLDESDPRLEAIVDRTEALYFADRYFVVLIEKGETHDSVIMYSVVLKCFYNMVDGIWFPKITAQLTKVCHSKIDLPEGTRIVSAEPASGHLSSSSLYPACKAPFVILTSCSDDVIRFWTCEKIDKHATLAFVWKESTMGENLTSSLTIPAPIIAISAETPARFACAFAENDGIATTVQVIVFECESSGGIEWRREDSLKINVAHPLPDAPSTSAAATTSAATMPTRESIRASSRISWVANESGTRILSVDILSTTHLFMKMLKYMDETGEIKEYWKHIGKVAMEGELPLSATAWTRPFQIILGFQTELWVVCLCGQTIEQLQQKRRGQKRQHGEE